MKNKNIFDNWKNILERINYKYDESDFKYFLEIYNSRKVSCAVYSLEFYKERFPKYDYHYIHQESVKLIKSKRKSMYDVEALMNKMKITYSEAEKIVNQRKEKTRGSLEAYIRKYGEEEGKIRYDNFRRKCVISRESLISKYGEEEGNIKWQNYKNTRDSGSIEYFLKKFNNDEETAIKERKKMTDKMSKSHQKETYIEKFIDGEKVYESICKSKDSSSIDFFIKKYGKTEKAYYEYMNSCKSKDSASLKYHISKYGEEEGVKKYNEMIEKLKFNSSIQGFIYRHGEEEGKRIFFENTIKRLRPSNNSSKSANKFFEELELFLGRKLRYSANDGELYIVNDKKIYFYDCYDEQSNTIIEYHCSLYHAHPTIIRDGIFNTYEENLKKDEFKKSLAISEGYNYLEVWYEDTLTTEDRVKEHERLKRGIQLNES